MVTGMQSIRQRMNQALVTRIKIEITEIVVENNDDAAYLLVISGR